MTTSFAGTDRERKPAQSRFSTPPSCCSLNGYDTTSLTEVGNHPGSPGDPGYFFGAKAVSIVRSSTAVFRPRRSSEARRGLASQERPESFWPA